jgi:5-methylthioribose kinase
MVSENAVPDRPYTPLNESAAAVYAAALPPLRQGDGDPGEVRAREVGDGNLNLVFIITSQSGRSCALKQALPYVRLVGESWPLTIQRNSLERHAHEIYTSITPDLVPHVYHADERQALFIMEDLSRLRIVRGALTEGVLFPRLAEDVARFAAETMIRTSDFYLDSGEKKRMVACCINPELCKITEDLVLTDPFFDAPSNEIEPELHPTMAELWHDTRAQDAVARLRHAFVTRAEALLHGDLHSGSVMASAEETKIVDAEFAFFGPVAFDIGMFIANLWISAIAHHTIRPEDPFARAIFAQADHAWRRFAERVEAMLIEAPIWRLPDGARREYLLALARDAAGFAGAEMIRRTIGLARVADLESIADRPTRLRAKAAVLAAGRALLRESQDIDAFEDAHRLVGHGADLLV